MVLTDTLDNAFDKVSLDIMGPLPSCQKGNSYILAIQDLLTKYSVAVPLLHASAIDVTEDFVSEYICVYIAPRAWLIDQTTHFLNSLMRIIAKKFGIIRYQATAYRLQTSGLIELSYHVLWEYWKQVVKNKQDWDEYLKLASFSYDTSVHEETGYSPHELMFDKTAQIPVSEPAIEDQNESYAQYFTELYNKLRETQSIARSNLIAAKERS